MTMDKVDDTSKAHPGRNQSASDDPLSTPYSRDVSAETSRRTQLQQTIDAQRAQLMQAHGVLTCLYEVLLHAEGEDAVTYAEAAHVAANLINKTAEELDSVRIGPLIDALLPASGLRVEEPRVVYWR
jgi:hypothetical protein